MDEQTLCISPSRLKGEIAIPTSKSHSLRALLFAMMGHGTSRIERLLDSTDTRAMCQAIQLFGATIDEGRVMGGFGAASGVVEAGQSGLVFRLLAALAALLPTPTRFSGDARRPITPLLSGLEQLGAKVTEGPTIQGPIHPGVAKISGIDSQPVSGLLIATAFLNGPSEILVSDPHEQPWVEMTLKWLKKLGCRVEHENFSHYWVPGGLSYEGFEYRVPGDFSSAAFSLAAALITGSTLTLTGLDFDDVQGDKILIDWLIQMGAQIDRTDQSLTIHGVHQLKGTELDLNLCIDALPILAVLGCYASGPTRLYGAAGARLKESDRIRSISSELKKMGAHIEELPNGLLIQPSSLKGADLLGHNDHRIAMALAVAALGATGPTQIRGSSCMAKTYPTFVHDFQKIGADYDLIWL